MFSIVGAFLLVSSAGYPQTIELDSLQPEDFGLLLNSTQDSDGDTMGIPQSGPPPGSDNLDFSDRSSIWVPLTEVPLTDHLRLITGKSEI